MLKSKKGMRFMENEDIKEETKPKKESKIDALFKRKEKLENTGPIPVVKEDNKTGIIMGLEDKEKLLIDASLETFVKYNEIYSTKGNALGRKQLRTAILDKDNKFKYFTNGGEKMLREKLKESIKILYFGGEDIEEANQLQYQEYKNGNLIMNGVALHNMNKRLKKRKN